MPEYLAPGVYIEEQNGINTIEGVSTSVAGFVGVTRRGPAQGLPQLVTSFNEFVRLYGGYADFAFGRALLPYAVDGFFANGGKKLYVMRVLDDVNATVASHPTKGGLVTRLVVDAPTGAGQTKITPATLRGFADTLPTTVTLTMVKNGITYVSNPINVASINHATGEVTLAANVDTTPVGQLPGGFEAKYTTVTTNINGLDANGHLTSGARPASFTISARDKGSWGKDVVVTVAPESAASTQLEAAGSGGGVAGNQPLHVKSVAGFYVGAWVEIDRGHEKRYHKIVSIDRVAKELHVDAPAGLNNAAFQQDGGGLPATTVSTCEFRITAAFEGATETFSGLTVENIPGRYYYDLIHNGSALIDVTAPPPPAASNPFLFPSADDGVTIALDAGGADGNAPSAADIVGGGAPGSRTGLKALEDVDDISIIAAPGLTDLVVQNALIEQCERLKYRFAILDPKEHAGGAAPTVPDILAQRNQYDTKYAAIYYPRLMMTKPLTTLDVPVPPSGHMAGIYARVDVERGVHKAPANEVVRDITGYELIVNKETQEILNPSPKNVNVFRDFRGDGRGLRIWGARCITSETEWKYINVRRLFIFLEKSLDIGTQFVVFEPNDERLWARVRQLISNFLTNVWRDGALMGTKPEEAFFVKCDRTTMTQDDLDNGKLIVIVGVAPVKPAEFVIIRIGQFTASANNQ